SDQFEELLGTSLATARSKSYDMTAGERAAFEEELVRREKEIRADFAFQSSYYIKRAENRYIAVKRADDASARLAADQTSAEAISNAAIEDTLNELDQTTESALDTAVEDIDNLLDGASPGEVESAWQSRMEALIEAGLRRWELAEEDLYARRLAWMEEAKQTRKEADEIWKTSHENLKEARSEWLQTVQQQIIDGRSRWEQKITDFEQSREVAERELVAFIESERAKNEASGGELANLVQGGGSALLEAKDAYRYYDEILKAKGVPTASQCSAAEQSDDLKLRCFYFEQRTFMGNAITRFRSVMTGSSNILGDILHSSDDTTGVLNDQRVYITQSMINSITSIDEDDFKSDFV
ncbi:MAG: hypothetical protein CVV45_21240, partial [Spirochaetae bacterium HGW-Spirochaetae-10]